MPSKKAATTHPAINRAPTFNQWDIIIVPFPFTNQPGSKRRPALVLSTSGFNRHGQIILAMITTAGHHPWPRGM